VLRNYSERRETIEPACGGEDLYLYAERSVVRAAGSAGPPVGANGQRQQHHEDARRPDQALPRLAWTGPAAMGTNAELSNVIGNNCSVM
jgi:hypothetical protein